MLLAIFLAASASATVVEADVLANVRAGRMICSNPDNVAKTCTTISRYELQTDGSLHETSEILFSPNQPVSFEVQAKTTLEKGAICGAMLQADLENGVVRLNGTPLPPDKSKAVIANLMEKLAPLLGRKACEVLRVEDGRLLKLGQMEGIDIPLPPKPVRWITADQGFKVAPPAR